MHKSLRRRRSTACKWIVVSYTLWLQTDLRTETSQFPIPEHCCASHYRSFSGDHFHTKNSEAALLYSSTALFHGCSRIAVRMSIRVCMVLCPAIRFPAKPTVCLYPGAVCSSCCASWNVQYTSVAAAGQRYTRSSLAVAGKRPTYMWVACANSPMLPTDDV